MHGAHGRDPLHAGKSVRERVDTLGANRLVYVVDVRQSLHFDQVFALARAAGWLPATVQAEHVPFGTDIRGVVNVQPQPQFQPVCARACGPVGLGYNLARELIRVRAQ